MANQNIIEEIHGHQEFLRSMDIEPKEFPIDKTLQHPEEEGLPHALFMLEEAEKFFNEGNSEHALRWLTFAEGVLWTNGQMRAIDLLVN